MRNLPAQIAIAAFHLWHCRSTVSPPSSLSPLLAANPTSVPSTDTLLEHSSQNPAGMPFGTGGLGGNVIESMSSRPLPDQGFAHPLAMQSNQTNLTQRHHELQPRNRSATLPGSLGYPQPQVSHHSSVPILAPYPTPFPFSQTNQNSKPSPSFYGHGPHGPFHFNPTAHGSGCQAEQIPFGDHQISVEGEPSFENALLQTADSLYEQYPDLFTASTFGYGQASGSDPDPKYQSTDNNHQSQTPQDHGENAHDRTPNNTTDVSYPPRWDSLPGPQK